MIRGALTNDPISDRELSGRELDAAVAERVMGFMPRVDLALFAITDARGGFTHSKDGDDWHLPCYSELTEAAMLIVEKMREWDKELEVEIHTSGDKWFVAFAADRMDGKGYQDIGEGAEAVTLPLAICHAALSATGTMGGS